MPYVEIRDLHVDVADRAILKGVNLTLEKGRTHAIMGPNGSGKSTLSYALAGRPGYTVTKGSVRVDGEDILALSAEKRARAGLFLAFQYPVEIPGVATGTFLKYALNAVRAHRGEPELDSVGFMKKIREKTAALGMGQEMIRRPVNVGFSGGEKKRLEMLQMSLLEPAFAVLDETDSGLDIDALKVVAEGVNAMRTGERAFLLITHYQRLLDYVQPDVVHVLADGRIVKTGGPELAKQLEETGYGAFVEETG